MTSLQVLKQNGSSEILNKLYDTAMDKLEVVKKDYDALRKRYSEKVAMHNSDLSRLEQLDEENQRLLKQTEMLAQQRNTAIQLQHQCALSLRRSVRWGAGSDCEVPIIAPPPHPQTCFSSRHFSK